MSPAASWASKVADYLAYRRTFGFDLAIEGGRLESFARFADQREAESLTVELPADWARASRRPHPISWARRIKVLRGFATFCLRTDSRTIVPQRNLFGPARRRLVPHIYTPAELQALLNAADRLTPHGGLRPATCETVFGLLAATGLRISEALKLTIADVALSAGVLDIRDVKCHQRRFIPLHTSVTAKMKAYAQIRDRLVSAPAYDRFFLRDDGDLLIGEWCRTRCNRCAANPAGMRVAIIPGTGYTTCDTPLS